MTTTDAGRAAARGPYAKSAERRQAIVDAAHQVFAARGYRGGSLQDVANVVGMSQTSLLHYFPTKRDLLLAVLDRRDSLGYRRAAPAGEPLIDSVLRQAQYNESVPGLIELYAVLSAEATTASHPGRDYFLDRFDRLRAGFASDFQALQDAGRLRPGTDPAVLATSLVALWDGLQLQWLLAPESVDVAAGLRAYLELVILPEPAQHGG
jgi:AcrR family transcriptional regulator